jgi:hypothetical protein
LGGGEEVADHHAGGARGEHQREELAEVVAARGEEDVLAG